MITFSPIKPLDYTDLKPFFKNQAYQLCVYSLPSILVWSNHKYKPYGYQDGETLYISVKWENDEHPPHLILPISSTKKHHPSELQSFAVKKMESRLPDLNRGSSAGCCFFWRPIAGFPAKSNYRRTR